MHVCLPMSVEMVQEFLSWVPNIWAAVLSLQHLECMHNYVGVLSLMYTYSECAIDPQTQFHVPIEFIPTSETFG